MFSPTMFFLSVVPRATEAFALPAGKEVAAGQSMCLDFSDFYSAVWITFFEARMF